MKVLVVEDDVTTRLLLSGALRKWGYDVVAVADGEDAWDEVKKREARLVITDWEMPRLDGAGLCKRIRTQLGSQYTYVLLLTNYKDPDHIVQGLSAGADDFISKPFNPLELQARLAVGQRILSLQDDLLEKNRELERLNLQLARIAATDALTQLGNRRSFDDALQRVHALSLRHGRPYGVLMADLDHFKSINDRFGHPAGDEILKLFAVVVSSGLRLSDLSGRIGGEEFAALLPCSLEEGVLVAERMRRAFQNSNIVCDEGAVDTTVSIGVAGGPAGTELEVLLAAADTALYQAKRTGRNKVEAAEELPLSLENWRRKSAGLPEPQRAKPVAA